MLQTISDYISKVTRGNKVKIGDTDAQWKKVSELTPGMMIAVPKSLPDDFNSLPTLSDVESTSLPKAEATTAEADIADIDSSDVAWDEIVSIRRLSPERVYDIEVEDTHNFIAGHLIETPLPKTIQIINDEPPRGPPLNNLTMKQCNHLTMKKWFGGIFAHNTYISANLGINTTAPDNKLDVAGAVAIGTYGLSLTGNTAPPNGLIVSGNVGIGTSLPTATLEVVSGASTTNAQTVTANSLSTGKLLSLTSTSTSLTTGGLLSIDWSPTGTTTAPTANIVNINVGLSAVVGNILNVQDNGSDVFSVSQSAITGALPANFTASGDVSIAYDLVFTNQTSSNIKSYGPLTIESGESFESNTLTFKTYNNGDMIFDIPLSGKALFGISSTEFSTKYQFHAPQLGGTNPANTAINVLSAGLSSVGEDGLGMGFTTGGAGGTAVTHSFIYGANGWPLLISGSSAGSKIWLGAGNKVGIGTTAPNSTLSVAGGVSIGSTYGTNGSTAPANGIIVQGNVGIGTTSPANKLSINGGASFGTYSGNTAPANGIIVSGSVGIGSQTASHKLMVVDSQATDYVAKFANMDTGTNADVLFLYIGANSSARNANNRYIAFGAGPNQAVGGKIQGSGNSSVAYTTNGADFAEYFRMADPNNPPLPGEVVSLNVAASKTVKKSDTPHDQNILGIVSTNPGFIGNGPVCFPNDADCDANYDKYNVIVALSGQIPAKVSTENGPINKGDPLTSSSIAGVAMKATKAGFIAGRALEDYSHTNGVGIIMVLTNNTWFDPDINQQPLFGSSVMLAESPQGFQLNYNGRNIQKIGIYKDAVIASLKSGLVNTQQLVAGTAQFVSANISSLLANTLTVSEKITSPVVETDTLRAQNITANGTATFGDIIVKGNEGQTVASIDASGNATFSGTISAKEGQFETLTVGSLENTAVATVAGLLTTNQLEAQDVKTRDATVSGTLYADKIESSTISTLQSSFGNLLNQFGTLQNQLATISATPTNLQPTTYLSAEASAKEDNLQPSSTPPPEADQPWAGTLTPTISSEQESSESAALISELPSRLSSVASLRGRIDDFLASTRGISSSDSPTTTVEIPKDLVLETLSVTGETSLADTTVAGSLMVDAGIVIENSSIVALTNRLNLSSFDTISFFGGKLVVDKGGNLTLEGTLLAKGGIITDSIKPIGKDLTIDLSDAVLGASTSSVPSEFGKLLITGLGGSPVASISATGDATFSGSLTADKLSILKTAYDATLSGIATSALQNIQQFGINAPGVMTQDSAGWAVLPGGSQEIIVSNSSITKDSLIYITPSSPTLNKTLFVADKNPGQYFRVAIDGPIPSDIKFNWWIIN